MSHIQQALRQACEQNFGETKEAEIIESAYMQQQLKTPRAFLFHALWSDLFDGGTSFADETETCFVSLFMLKSCVTGVGNISDTSRMEH